MIKTIRDFKDKVEQLRDKGVVRGLNTGFKCLDDLYSVKYGSYTIIYAEPTHGKSEFIFEICLNQANHEKRTLLCSPETGSVEEIIAELIHKYTGKQIFKSNPYCLSDVDFNNALLHLDHYFVIVDTDHKSYSIPDLFKYADEWEGEHKGYKIDIIVGEPYNELDHSDMGLKFGARQDLYIEDLIGEVRRLCRTKNRHFFLSVHPSGSSIPVTKDKSTYYPKPLPRQAAGGQALYRKAMTWITLWRPPAGLQDEDGVPYSPNEVHIYVDKAKPKGVSFKGKCVMYFDWQKNRYYEGFTGNEMYAFDHDKKYQPLVEKPQQAIAPSLKFDTAINDSNPF